MESCDSVTHSQTLQAGIKDSSRVYVLADAEEGENLFIDGTMLVDDESLEISGDLLNIKGTIICSFDENGSSFSYDNFSMFGCKISFDQDTYSTSIVGYTDSANLIGKTDALAILDATKYLTKFIVSNKLDYIEYWISSLTSTNPLKEKVDASSTFNITIFDCVAYYYSYDSDGELIESNSLPYDDYAMTNSLDSLRHFVNYYDGSITIVYNVEDNTFYASSSDLNFNFYEMSVDSNGAISFGDNTFISGEHTLEDSEMYLIKREITTRENIRNGKEDAETIIGMLKTMLSEYAGPGYDIMLGAKNNNTAYVLAEYNLDPFTSGTSRSIDEGCPSFFGEIVIHLNVTNSEFHYYITNFIVGGYEFVVSNNGEIGICLPNF